MFPVIPWFFLFVVSPGKGFRLSDSSEIVIGNVVGSHITNIFLIRGVTAFGLLCFLHWRIVHSVVQ
jgi:hypothetical protein